MYSVSSIYSVSACVYPVLHRFCRILRMFMLCSRDSVSIVVYFILVRFCICQHRLSSLCCQCILYAQVILYLSVYTLCSRDSVSVGVYSMLDRFCFCLLNILCSTDSVSTRVYSVLDRFLVCYFHSDRMFRLGHQCMQIVADPSPYEYADESQATPCFVLLRLMFSLC